MTRGKVMSMKGYEDSNPSASIKTSLFVYLLDSGVPRNISMLTKICLDDV